MRLMDPSQPTTNPLPERNTIRAALAGDQAAFQELVYLYGRRIYAVAYGVVQDAAEAEDIVQETFLKAYSRRDSLRDPDRFPAWLFQTARNHALDTLRKRRPIPFPNQQAGLEQIADDAVPSPSAGLSLADRDHAVRTLLLTHLVPAPAPGTEQEWLDQAAPHFGGAVILATDLLTVDAPG